MHIYIYIIIYISFAKGPIDPLLSASSNLCVTHVVVTSGNQHDH